MLKLAALVYAEELGVSQFTFLDFIGQVGFVLPSQEYRGISSQGTLGNVGLGELKCVPLSINPETVS